MKGECCRRQALHKEAIELVYKGFNNFKRKRAICICISFSLRHQPSFVSVSIEVAEV
jgi:hypothetical protein